MTVTLRPVTRDNWSAVVDMQLAPGQEHFVASNTLSLAQAYAMPECQPFAVYAGEEPVGFVMIGREPETGREWVIRLMVDARHQGQGYGRAALNLAIERLRETTGCDAVYLSYEPNNDVAARLYASVGFVLTGEIDDGEVVARLDLRPGSRE
jgi:diamine N-acetyltransferase